MEIFFDERKIPLGIPEYNKQVYIGDQKIQYCEAKLITYTFSRFYIFYRKNTLRLVVAINHNLSKYSGLFERIIWKLP